MSNWTAATYQRGPSPHLSWAELACHDALRTGYPLDWREGRAMELARLFETIRAACGGHPLTVLSAYRTAAHNAAVHGSPRSQHLFGRALDLRPPQGWSVERFHAQIAELEAQGSLPLLKGLGLYARFCHVDIRRPAETLVSWDMRQIPPPAA